MPNPQWELPFDKHGRLASYYTPRGLAIDTHYLAISQSSHVELDETTTLVQVTAISKDMFLKWAVDGEDYAQAKDHDEFIPAGTTVFLHVPLKSDGSFYSGLQVVGRESGGKISIVEK